MFQVLQGMLISYVEIIKKYNILKAKVIGWNYVKISRSKILQQTIL